MKPALRGKALACGRKDDLFERYNIAVLCHAVASRLLANLAGTCVQGEYDSLHKRVQQFRVNFEEARRAFENHVAEHGC